MRNVAFRSNHAANGGALYTEGSFAISEGEIEHNRASFCGGALYVAREMDGARNRAHLDKSNIGFNSDSCESFKHTARDETPLPPPPMPALPMGTGGGGGIHLDTVQPASPPKKRTKYADVSGAIAEGVRLEIAVLLMISASFT
jgi:predicted outer membrane repeat protein